jgi:hypothetical protein
MLIASWLVALDPKRTQDACRKLLSSGREIRSKSGSRWLVLLTETPQDQELNAVRQEILATPGVEAADPIASFNDEDAAQELVRW